MGKKVKTLLFSFVPIALFFIAEIIGSSGYVIGTGLLTGIFYDMEWGKRMLDFLEKDGIYLLSIMNYLLFLIPAIFWYKSRRRFAVRKNMRILTWAGLALTGIVLQIGISYLLNILYMVSPDFMNHYTEIMENLGMGSPTLLSVIYVVVVAPVTEELLTRGLCLGILKTSFPFWIANLIQAFYFGALHMNLVQGAYAFLMGIVLGYVAHRYGTLKASIYLHFIINLSGELLSLLG
ncbi:MAG: lysostaphin resistance A-like protein [Blautia sp.]